MFFLPYNLTRMNVHTHLPVSACIYFLNSLKLIKNSFKCMKGRTVKFNMGSVIIYIYLSKYNIYYIFTLYFYIKTQL